MYSFGYRLLAVSSLLGSIVLALQDADSIKNSITKSIRSTNTCADPTVAEPMFQAFNVDATQHQLNFLEVFETSNSLSGRIVFANELPAFNAWPTQQEFLNPIWQLGRNAGGQVIYTLGTDAQTPPVVTGFSAGGIVAWAYSTQVCGSIPLMSATLTSVTDSFYTTRQSLHSGLLGVGWTDTGVVAFVLPLSFS